MFLLFKSSWDKPGWVKRHSSLCGDPSSDISRGILSDPKSQESGARWISTTFANRLECTLTITVSLSQCVMECTLTIGWECTPTNPLFKTFSLWFYTPRSPGVLLCCGCSFDLLSPDNSRTRWYVRRGSVSRWKMCLYFQQNKKRRGTREGRCRSKTMMSTETSEFDWTLNTRMKVWSSFYY